MPINLSRCDEHGAFTGDPACETCQGSGIQRGYEGRAGLECPCVARARVVALTDWETEIFARYAEAKTVKEKAAILGRAGDYLRGELDRANTKRRVRP